MTFIGGSEKAEVGNELRNKVSVTKAEPPRIRDLNTDPETAFITRSIDTEPVTEVEQALPLSNTDDCISYDAYREAEQSLLELGGQGYDYDGQQAAEDQYLEALETNALEGLAKQGYANAMAKLANRLLTGDGDISDDEDKPKRGIAWAKAAAEYGRVDALGGLMAHYIQSQQHSVNEGNTSEAKAALINFESIRLLLEHAVPGISQNSFDTSELSDQELLQTKVQATTLIQNYNKKRQQLGFDEKPRPLPSYLLSSGSLTFCEDTRFETEVQ